MVLTGIFVAAVVLIFWSSSAAANPGVRSLVSRERISVKSYGMPAGSGSSRDSATVTSSIDGESAGLTLAKVVSEALRRDPQIRIQRDTLEIKRGAQLSAAGTFDWRLRSGLSKSKEYTPYSYPVKILTGIAKTTGFSTIFDFGLSKLFRSGISLSPQIRLQRSDNGMDKYNPYNTARIQFNLAVPLLKGRGEEAVAASERSAGFEYTAGGYQLIHTISQQLSSVVGAYWNYVAATSNLAISRESEARTMKMTNDTRTLIEMGERPAAEIKQLEAYLSDRTSERISMEQQLLEARHNLALAIGRIGLREIELLEGPADPFPVAMLSDLGAEACLSMGMFAKGIEILALATDLPEFKFALTTFPDNGWWGLKMSDAFMPGEFWENLLVDLAVSRRNDLIAQKERIKGASVSLTSARDALQPDLNLNLTVGYSGIEEGHSTQNFIDPLVEGIYGMNVSASLNYDLPVDHKYDRGVVVQAEANVRILKTQALDIERRIRSSVKIALSSLRTTMELLKRAQESISLYEEAVENEKKKVDLGMATILDVVNMEDRLTNARKVLVSYQGAFANALSRLRYVTGTMVTQTQDGLEVEGLTTIPDVEVRGLRTSLSRDPRLIVGKCLRMFMPHNRREWMPLEGNEIRNLKM